MADNSVSDHSEGLQTAGDVNVEEAVIIRNDGAEMDIRTFIIELNIFEDMFKNGLSGNIMMVDAANIVGKFPILGDEYIRLKIKTPSLETQIYKTFKIYSITNRRMIQDTGTQSYLLHFCSTELFVDMAAPVYGNFEGKVVDHVTKIYTDNLSMPRNAGDGDETPLIIFGEPTNEITFTSPGWSAMRCLNWLASHSVNAEYKSPSYLFFETTQAFQFANVEFLIDGAIQDKGVWREYVYMANNISDNTEDQYVKNVDLEYKKIEELEIVDTFNAFNNVQSGYYANRLVTLDLLTKHYEVFDYDHVASYPEYKHMEDIAGGARPPFNEDTLRAPAAYTQFYSKQSKLFDNAPNNIQNIIEQTVPRRLSVLQELSNFKVIITVPGRCDCQVGNVIYLVYPDARPRNEQDKSKSLEDPLFSGFYLITAVRHKITLQKHMMIMEVVKDSYRKANRGEQ